MLNDFLYAVRQCSIHGSASHLDVIAFLVLPPAVTPLPVVQVIGLSAITEVTTRESTVASTHPLLDTYFGSSSLATVAQTAVSFREGIGRTRKTSLNLGGGF